MSVHPRANVLDLRTSLRSEVLGVQGQHRGGRLPTDHQRFRPAHGGRRRRLRLVTQRQDVLL